MKYKVSWWPGLPKYSRNIPDAFYLQVKVRSRHTTWRVSSQLSGRKRVDWPSDIVGVFRGHCITGSPGARRDLAGHCEQLEVMTGKRAGDVWYN
jgi:hypothetical protein